MYSGCAERGFSAPTRRLPLPPLRAIERTASAASFRAASEMSSEYENAVRSPATARTPTPCWMSKLPLLTMPSSSENDSLRVYWKYRSA